MKSFVILLDHPFFDARRRLRLMPDNHWRMQSASLQFMSWRVERLKREHNELSKVY